MILRAVHTTDDNYNDSALNIVLIKWKKESPCHSYTDNDTVERYCWNQYQNDFVQLVNNKNIDSQSGYTWLDWALGFKRR